MGNSSKLLHKAAKFHIASGLLVAITLWLTLAPKPLGENPPPFFPGADKLAHTLMFMAICGGYLYERLLLGILYRKTIVATTITCALFGALTEVGQALMNRGRAFEWGDIIADSTGAILAGVFAFLYLHNYHQSD